MCAAEEGQGVQSSFSPSHSLADVWGTRMSRLAKSLTSVWVRCPSDCLAQARCRGPSGGAWCPGSRTSCRRGRPLARLSSHRARQWWCGSAAASARRHRGRAGRWLWTVCAGKQGGHLRRVRRRRLSQNAAEQFRWCLPCCLRQCLQLGFAPHSHAAQRLRSGH